MRVSNKIIDQIDEFKVKSTVTVWLVSLGCALVGIRIGYIYCASYLSIIGLLIWEINNDKDIEEEKHVLIYKEQDYQKREKYKKVLKIIFEENFFKWMETNKNIERIKQNQLTTNEKFFRFSIQLQNFSISNENRLCLANEIMNNCNVFKGVVNGFIKKVIAITFVVMGEPNRFFMKSLIQTRFLDIDIIRFLEKISESHTTYSEIPLYDNFLKEVIEESAVFNNFINECKNIGCTVQVTHGWFVDSLGIRCNVKVIANQ